MNSIYHWVGFVVFWIAVLIALWFLWEYHLKETRFGDWIFVILSWLFVWFKKDNADIQRRLDFLDAGYSDKGKKRWEYKLIVKAYKLKLKHP